MSFATAFLSRFFKPATSPTPLAELTRYAHRGLAIQHTENTLAAFSAAVSAGAQWLEIDVHTSTDGTIFVFHDSTLNRVAGISGRIDQKTFEQVRQIQLPGGELIPTLAETFAAFPDTYFNIDLKDEGSARAIGRVLAESGAAQRVRLASFSQSRLGLARQSLRDAGVFLERWGASEASLVAFYLSAHLAPSLWPLVSRLPTVGSFDALQIPLTYRVLGQKIPVLTNKLIKVAHRFGYRVDAWTIDDPVTMKELARVGIDGIVSNRVDLLAKLAD